jgi:hypothetical protein
VTRISGIYAICNTRDGHAYIGLSCNIAERWRQHERYLRRGEHPARGLQVAYDQHGVEPFALLILERREAYSRWVLDDREAFWLVRARAAGVVLYNDQVGKGRRKAA